MERLKLKQLPLILSERTARNLVFALSIVVASFFFGKAIVEHNMRLAIITGLLFILWVFCLRVQTGIFALLIFLPFMAFVRRYIYVFNPFTAFDPILMVGPVLTIFMFLYLMLFCRHTIMGPYKKNSIVKFATWLLIVYIIAMVNPLQGGPLVGLAGALFFIIPTLWFYFGRFIDKKKIEILLYITVFIGIIACLHGLRQAFFGYLSFEQYWAQFGGFASLNVRGFLRPVSTFASSQEYTTYIMLAGIISYALAMKNRKNIPLLAVIGLVVFALVMSATRGALLGLFFGIGLYTLLGLKRVKRIVVMLLLFFAVYVGLTIVIDVPYVPVAAADTAYLTHTLSGVFDPLAEHSTFWIHRDVTRGAFSLMFRNPIGYGLGAGSLGAMRFGGRTKIGEGFITSLQSATGLFGYVIFLILMFLLLRNSFSRYRDTGDFFSKLLFVITLSVYITVDLRLYSVGPFVWLLWGYQAYRKD
ncbi:hypothetical protein LR066_04365 [candidate division WOR-3 bacterium]|nr:hypothetical protein [candidate division WOR-3 bacterium]